MKRAGRGSQSKCLSPLFIPAGFSVHRAAPLFPVLPVTLSVDTADGVDGRKIVYGPVRAIVTGFSPHPSLVRGSSFLERIEQRDWSTTQVRLVSWRGLVSVSR